MSNPPKQATTAPSLAGEPWKLTIIKPLPPIARSAPQSAPPASDKNTVSEPQSPPPHPPSATSNTGGGSGTGSRETESIALHPQFVWADEFTWQKIARSDPIYTLTGAVIIESSTKQGGRPITLNGDNVWLSKKELDTLFALSQSNNTYQLSIPGDHRVLTVAFAKQGLLNVAPIIPYRQDSRDDGDWWRCDLAFIEL